VSYQQLYYTSCETGLSGYAGYQFNAVTDGTSVKTMRAVEALTSYEPPHSRAQASSPGELDQCPVNLCFVPGETTVLASVSYVGRDSTNRVGNYFAHALATSDLDADDPELLPIELWRAPWWSRTASAVTALPALAGPLVTGDAVSREQVARFLAAHPRRDQLTALLTAAGLARDRDDRSALVVAKSADEVTAWFAAASYLLPPRWVRGLSFSTYLSRPSRSRLHLLGTLSETNLDLGPDATERFYLFDFPGQRFASLPPHPLARLCISIGLLALPALWSWADTLASGREATLDDWYPVAGAAAALGGVTLTASDLDAVANWLCERDDLEKGTRNAIARAVHGQPPVTMDTRRTLREVSARAGDDVLWEQVSYELLEPPLRARTDGPAAWSAVNGAAVPPGCAPAAERVRDQLTATAEEELRLAADPADVLSLLDWSCQAGLRVDPDVLAECGRTMIAPLLATGDGMSRRLPPAQREQAARVTQQWPQVREGIVRHLTDMADRAPALAAVALSGLTGQLLQPGDIAEGSPIRALYLACEAVRRNEDPVQILAALARQREIAAADGLLLHLLWPDGRWTLTDARRVLADVDPDVLGGAADWFEAVVAARPATTADSTAYGNLCTALMSSPLAGHLAAPTRPALTEVHDLWRACAAARGRRRLADLQQVLRAASAGRSAPAVTLGREWLAPLVVNSTAGKPGEIMTALSRLSAPAMRRYLELTRERFRNPDPGCAVHAAALYELQAPAASTAWARPYEDRIGEILLYAARWWRKEWLEQTAQFIDGVRVTDGKQFREQVGLVRAGRLGGLVKVARGVRGLFPAGRGDAAPPGPPGDGARPVGGSAAPER
jgi:GTPase-associated protein 1, N-terminal domain type 2/GTPase-associated protein 1, C-terminal domain/GTPase-associated protein 1, middle domain